MRSASRTLPPCSPHCFPHCFSRFILGLGLLAQALATLVPASATECAAVREGVAIGDAVRVVADDSAPHQRALIDAIQHWSQCPGYGETFPSFVTGAAGFRTVRVDFRDQSHENICGQFTRNQIVIYAWAFNSLGRRVRCAPPSTTLTHELGHVLGLLDAPREARCESFIMAPDNQYGPLRAIDASECERVATHWQAAHE